MRASNSERERIGLCSPDPQNGPYGLLGRTSVWLLTSDKWDSQWVNWERFKEGTIHRGVGHVRAPRGWWGTHELATQKAVTALDLQVEERKRCFWSPENSCTGGPMPAAVALHKDRSLCQCPRLARGAQGEHSPSLLLPPDFSPMWPTGQT